jgi:hypothetical protein
MHRITTLPSLGAVALLGLLALGHPATATQDATLRG